MKVLRQRLVINGRLHLRFWQRVLKKRYGSWLLMSMDFQKCPSGKEQCWLLNIEWTDPEYGRKMLCVEWYNHISILDWLWLCWTYWRATEKIEKVIHYGSNTEG